MGEQVNYHINRTSSWGVAISGTVVGVNEEAGTIDFRADTDHSVRQVPLSEVSRRAVSTATATSLGSGFGAPAPAFRFSDGFGAPGIALPPGFGFGAAVPMGAFGALPPGGGFGAGAGEVGMSCIPGKIKGFSMPTSGFGFGPIHPGMQGIPATSPYSGFGGPTTEASAGVRVSPGLGFAQAAGAPGVVSAHGFGFGPQGKRIAHAFDLAGPALDSTSQAMVDRISSPHRRRTPLLRRVRSALVPPPPRPLPPTPSKSAIACGAPMPVLSLP